MKIKEYVLEKGGTVQLAEQLSVKYPYAAIGHVEGFPAALREAVDSELSVFLNKPVSDVVKYFVEHVTAIGELTTLEMKHSDSRKYINEVYKGKEVVLKIIDDNHMSGIIYEK